MDFQSDLVDYIISRLSGTHDLDKEIDRRPSEYYILGSLAPLPKMGDTISKRVTTIRATTMSVGFLADNKEKAESSVDVTISFFVYYKIRSGRKNIWRRSGRHSISTALQLSDDVVELDFSSICEDISEDEDCVLSFTESPWSAEIRSSRRPFSEKSMVTIELRNTERHSKDHELALFDVEINIDLKDIKHVEFCDEYDYEGFRQRYYYDFRTRNCQAVWSDEQPNTIMTKTHALYTQDRILPRNSWEGIDLSFAALSKDDFLKELDLLESTMEKYLELYKEHQELMKSKADDSGWVDRKDNRQMTFEELRFRVQNYDTVLEFYKKGLECIKTDPAAFRAFKLMNKTFTDYFSNREGLEPTQSTKIGWRLFQILFIVMNVRTISEDAKNESNVDVLHVGTGGGKSEAYFGLSVFLMFYDRLTGKKSGVTTLVKFPLRMLSIQQLARLSSIVAYADKTRSEAGDIEGDPFSLGYFVGSKEGSFPDLFGRLSEKVKKTTNQKGSSPVSTILSKCPLCPSQSRGDVLLEVDDQGHRVLHVCNKNPEHIFHIYMSDRESYRFRPTILVSTVDKWANLSYQRRARSLLGGAGSICPDGHGFISAGEVCENNSNEAFTCDNEGGSQKNIGPRLQVQDEIHLLQESFGSIASHFEGLIEQLVLHTSERPLKHVAMSATMAGVRKHIRMLYNKEHSIIIPGICPLGEGSANDIFFKKEDNPARLIMGLKPNLRDNHYATLRTLQHSFEFIALMQKQL
ncbi:MAG: hypothetical protein ACFFCX_16840, partial [Candidatus Sifarchaeia archaeon]